MLGRFAITRLRAGLLRDDRLLDFAGRCRPSLRGLGTPADFRMVSSIPLGGVISVLVLVF